MKDFYVSDSILIPFHEIEFTYARSSGPGGQNVNKVNSKAILRWNLAANTCINDELKAYLIERLSTQLTLSGEILISSDVFRDQIRNREECLKKLKELLLQAAWVPKKRKKTKLSWSRKKKNEKSKKLHSEKKKLRKFRAE